MDGSSKIPVAFLSLYPESYVHEFIKIIGEKEPRLECRSVKLSNQDLQSFHMPSQEKYNSVVLLHSVIQGRHSITDVADAKYTILLETLKNKYGASRVAVIVHSIASLQSHDNKDVMMRTFKSMQPTTFKCSDCVITCDNLLLMDNQDLTDLAKFLAKEDDASCATMTHDGEADRQSHTSECSTGKDNQTLKSRETEERKLFMEPHDALTTIALHSLVGSNTTLALREALQTKFSNKCIIGLKEQQKPDYVPFDFKAVLVDVGQLRNGSYVPMDDFLDSKTLMHRIGNYDTDD